MNKEQTHKQINYLIHLYEKRISTCSTQWDELNERWDKDLEMEERLNGLNDEMDLIEGFIDDLKSLKEDDE